MYHLAIDRELHKRNQIPFDIALMFAKEMGPSVNRKMNKPHLGYQKYFGRRNSSQASLSPTCGPRVIHEQCYQWTQRWNGLIMPFLIKKAHSLAWHATQFGKAMDRDLHALCPSENQVFSHNHFGILTQDGFASVPHVDENDKIKDTDHFRKMKILHESENSQRKATSILKKYKTLGGLGSTCTCAYQFIHRNHQEGTYIEQYFSLDGLGLMARLCNFSGMTFHAYLFSHSTPIPVVHFKNGFVQLPSLNNGHTVFAWGGGASNISSSSKKSNKRKRNSGNQGKNKKKKTSSQNASPQHKALQRIERMRQQRQQRK